MTKRSRHLFDEIRFLFRAAKEDAVGVIVFAVTSATATIALNMTILAALPLLFWCAQRRCSPVEWMTVVGVTAVLLLGLRAAVRYTDGALSQSRDRFRTRGGTRLVRKALTVSYPTATDPARASRLNRAAAAMGTHIDAPAAHSWKTLCDLLVSGVGVLLTAALLSGRYTVLLAVTLTTALLGAVVHRAVSELGGRHGEEEQRHRERLRAMSRLASDPRPSKDIRVFGLATWICAMYDTTAAALGAIVDCRARIYTLYTFADAVLTVLTNGIALAVLVRDVTTGTLSIAAFVLYVATVGLLTQSVRGVVSNAATLSRELDSIGAYRAYLETEDAFLTEGGALPKRGAHTLELRDVTFTYPDADKPILKHINLTLRAGETLAVVGRDGVGKTTLVRLLCGLYDPDEGTVLLDGVDVKTLDRRAYYELFSTVFQENSLPAMTVAEIVSCQTDDVDHERLWRCLEQADLASTVLALPNEAQTVIGQTANDDGVKLSGGERQRLLLARALYKDGDILLLDEPTAALDPLAEHALYQEYDRMTDGKSAVFISHRLASTRFCDRIIYLKDGTIAEEGSHEELLARGGEYARLFEVQSRYYREGRDPDDDEIGTET